VPAKADPKRVSKLLAEARAESLEGKEAVAKLILSGLKTSSNEHTENETLLANSVAELLEKRWDNRFKNDLARVNLADPDLWIARSRIENADATIAETGPILREAWKRAMAIEGNDERKGAYLVNQIQRIAQDSRASTSTKGLLNRIISDFEAIVDASGALEQFRVAYLDPNVVEPVSGDDETTDPSQRKGITSYAPANTEQPNLVSRSRVPPGDPSGHGDVQTHPRDVSPLSESEMLYERLGAEARGLDTIALRHLVRQARALRGDSQS